MEIHSTLIIDRSIWLRGEGTSVSRLIRPSDNKMCCLGFMGKQCGIEDKYLKDMQTPLDANYEITHSSKLDFVVAFSDPMHFLIKDEWDSPLSQLLMEVNDCEIGKDFIIPRDLRDKYENIAITSEAVREMYLTKIFATVGWAVQFIN